MATFVVYEVWTRSKVVTCSSEASVYSANRPEPVKGMSLCNWHAVEVRRKKAKRKSK